MTGEQETTRLLDDAATPPELRDLLDAAVADAPSAGTSARMMARLDALAVSPTTAAPAAVGAAKWLLLALAGAVVVGAGVYGIAQRGSGDAPAQPPHAALSVSHIVTRAAKQPRAPHPASPQRGEQPDGIPSPARGGLGRGASTPGDSSPTSVAKEQPAARTPRPTKPQSETVIIKLARRALSASDYRRALRAAEQHMSLYAEGVLTEEREAIAIEALAGLERAVAARARLERFLAAYPASSYRERLRELVRSLPQ